MARDAAGLVEQLDVGGVHVVGVSMGGCISQALTLAHPELVRSLTSMSSSTGSRRVGHARLDVVGKLLLGKPAKSRAEAIALSESMFRRIGSPGYPIDVERLSRIAGLAYDRRYDPAGSARQFAAILGSPDRTAALANVAVPTLVMHGEADPLIGVSGGRATAAAVPNSRLVTFPGMGHDIPEPLWPRFAVGSVGRDPAGHGQPLIPRNGPVVEVTVIGGERHAGAGHLDGVSIDRRVEVFLRALGRQVDAAVTDVRVALIVNRSLVLVNELAVVADPHGPVLDDVGVAVGRVAHPGGLVLVDHHVDPGPRDPVRVADVVAATERGGIGGDPN